MASYPSSRISFLSEAGAKIARPGEGRKCGIVIDVPKEMHSQILLTLEGEQLSVHTVGSAAAAFAKWPPSNPGNYTLSLICGDIREQKTVTVMPEHFTETDIATLLSDLTDLLPKSIAAHLRQCGAQVGAEQAREQSSSVEEEWLKLRQAIVGTNEKLGLLQILPIIQRECNQILLPRLEVRTANKIRRPDISRLPQAISMPGNMISSDELYQMFDITVEQSLETYENQLVKTYVQLLRSRLARLQSKVKAEGAPPAMINELDALANEFHLAHMRASFLRRVKRSSILADRVTMVLLKNPAYRAVLEGYLALNQQSSTTLEEQALTAPLNKFPFLYQLWANLRVFNGLLQVCAESGYRCVSHHWVKSYRKGAFVQATNDGQIAVQMYSPTSGTQVNLIPLRPAQDNPNLADPEAHMSLAIAIEAPMKPLVVLLFDPRYKVATKSENKDSSKKAQSKTKSHKNKPEVTVSTEPMPEDVEAFLRSIDLLREPGAEQQIQFAALMYPGQHVQLSPGVDAVSAHPAYGELLQNNVCDLLRRYLV